MAQYCVGELSPAKKPKQSVLNEQQLAWLRENKAFADLERLTSSARAGTEASRLANRDCVMVEG